jgi:hypothetical protein
MMPAIKRKSFSLLALEQSMMPRHPCGGCAALFRKSSRLPAYERQVETGGPDLKGNDGACMGAATLYLHRQLDGNA